MEQLGAKIPRLFRFAESHDKTVLTRRNRDGTARLVNSLHMLRDGDAFAYVSFELVASLQMRFGGVLLNLPSDTYANLAGPEGDGFLGRLGESDLVVRTTRPTCPDYESDSRYQYGRSGTPLEAAIADADTAFFRYCNRETIWLSEAIARQVGPRDPYARIDFQRHGGGRRDGSHGLFIGYVTVAWLPGRRTAILNCFSADGVSTLLWAYLLATELSGTLPELVRRGEPSLLVGEFDLTFPRRRIEHLSELSFKSVAIRRDVRLAPMEARRMA
jgi:hypothetical protein